MANSKLQALVDALDCEYRDTTCNHHDTKVSHVKLVSLANTFKFDDTKLPPSANNSKALKLSTPIRLILKHTESSIWLL